MNNLDDELRKDIEEIVKKHMQSLEQFLESDRDDFTGMHTTKGIPEDSFYGGFYEIARQVVTRIAAEREQLLDEVERELDTISQGEIVQPLNGSDTTTILAYDEVKQALNKLRKGDTE